MRVRECVPLTDCYLIYYYESAFTTQCDMIEFFFFSFIKLSTVGNVGQATLTEPYGAQIG